MAQDPTDQDNDTDLSDAQVVDHLRENPDFLIRHPDLLQVLAPPARELGDGVEDMQQHMINTLRNQVSKTEDLAQLLIDNSRDNLTSQTQIHECVLSLLEANSFRRLIEIATTDLANYLNLDVVTLCVEVDEAMDLDIDGLHHVSPGTTEQLVPQPYGVKLQEDVSGNPELFGGVAPLVQSQALVRLDVSPDSPPALLAFGSRETERFHHNQATELLQFLGRTMAELIRIWLGLAPQGGAVNDL